MLEESAEMAGEKEEERERESGSWNRGGYSSLAWIGCGDNLSLLACSTGR